MTDQLFAGHICLKFAFDFLVVGLFYSRFWGSKQTNIYEKYIIVI